MSFEKKKLSAQYESNRKLSQRYCIETPIHAHMRISSHTKTMRHCRKSTSRSVAWMVQEKKPIIRMREIQMGFKVAKKIANRLKRMSLPAGPILPQSPRKEIRIAPAYEQRIQKTQNSSTIYLPKIAITASGQLCTRKH